MQGRPGAAEAAQRRGMQPHDGEADTKEAEPVSGRARSRQVLIAGQCGAKTRAGTPCAQPAGWGTDHVGWGRCKLHGGATPTGHRSPHYKHGRRCRDGAFGGPGLFEATSMLKHIHRRFNIRYRFLLDRCRGGPSDRNVLEARLALEDAMTARRLRPFMDGTVDPDDIERRSLRSRRRCAAGREHRR